MAYTDNQINQLIINKLTQAQFDSLDSKSETELYFITDDDDSSGNSITVDDTLSDTSENPVQNKIITQRLNELNTLASKEEIFIAEYNITTFAELQNAYNEGKILFCKQDTQIYPLTSNSVVGGNLVYAAFSQINSDGTRIQVSTSGTWSSSTEQVFLKSTGGTITGTTESTSTSTGALIVAGGLGVAKTIYANAVYGAVWNDYAEYRESNITEPGRVICENGDDTLSLAIKRLQPGANVVSDTFGFAIGKTEKAQTPIAVSGRVLVYTYEDRETYKPGDAVCAAPGGTVSKMSREEIMTYPERIIGTVSAIPMYETWGENNVPVNGRIWIKVR